MIPFVIFFSYGCLAVLPDIGLAIPELIALTGGIIVLLAVCQLDSAKFQSHTSPLLILFLAAVFRAMFLWRVPELSDDIFRYLFDGLMTFSGHNPYAVAPKAVDAVTLAGIPGASGIATLVNHGHLPTIYPPAAQVVFAAGVLCAKLTGTGTLFAMKLLLVCMDLATCSMVIFVLKKLHQPVKRAILYAWHPLPIIEIAASGHIDAAAMFFFIAAVSLVIAAFPAGPNKSAGNTDTVPVQMILAGSLMALAVFTKWFPLVFIPGWLLLIRLGNRRYAVLGGVVIAAVLTGLFVPDFINGLQTLNTYLQNWEFSGFAFRQLRHLTGSGQSARMILGAGFLIIMGLACWQAKLKQTSVQVVKSFWIIAFAYLVLTPTLHPWYALYLTLLLPFVAGSGVMASVGLTFSWAVFLAYRVLILYRVQGGWIEDDVTALLVVLAPVMSFLAMQAVKMNARLSAHIN